MHAGEHALYRSEVAIKPKRLEGAGDTHGGDGVRRPPSQLTGGRALLELDTAGLGADVAGYEVDQRRLAGAVGADQAEDGAFLDFHRHVINGVYAAERTVDVSELQQRAHAFSSASTSAAR